MRTLKTRFELPEKARPLLKPAPYKALYGGRGSAKSQTVARLMLQMAVQERHRILCAREIQKSISNSVMPLLVEQIAELGYGDLFEATKTSIRCINGSEFIFAGLRTNIDSIRSMHRISRVWVEEAHSVSQDSWDILIPTVERVPGAEIWFTFNPEHETDPAWKMVNSPMPGTIAVEMNWPDNPWFPDGLRHHMEYLYSVDPEAADWIYGGRLRKKSKAEVLGGKWVVEDFEPQPDWHGPYQGADWGFAAHPTAMVRCWVSGDPNGLERELWIEYEAYGVGVDNDELPQLFDSIPGARKYVTRADSARPETIRHMQTHGYPRFTACAKGAGSVEDGIRHLRGYKRIIIHPRCKYWQDEARLYKYKTDKISGDVLPVVIKAHDHCLVGDTRIDTDDGPVPIASLVGRHGRTVTGEKFDRVRAVPDEQPVFRVTLDDGSTIRTTGEHLFFSVRGWQFAENLHPGDLLLDGVDAMRHALQSWHQGVGGLMGLSPRSDETTVSMTLSGNVLCVETGSFAIDTEGLKRAVRAAQCGWRTVIAVVPDGVERVFNLETVSTHLFTVCGGIVTHNCVDATRYALEPVMKRDQIVYDGYQAAAPMSNKRLGKQPASKTTTTARSGRGTFRGRRGGVL